MSKKADVLLILAAVIIVLAVFFTFKPTITGNYAYDENLLDQVKDMSNQLPIFNHMKEGAEMCVIVPKENEYYSFNIDKIGTATKIEPSPYSRYCNNDIYNKGPEDFVVKFTTYESFLELLDKPTCDNLKNSLSKKDILFLPSEFVEVGGKPVCNELFRERYCNAFNFCLTNSEMTSYKLRCCIEKKGLYMIPGFGTWYFWVLGIIAVICFFVVFYYFYEKHNKIERKVRKAQNFLHTVESYVREGLRKGHKKEDIKKRLIEQGWDEEIVNHVLELYK